MKIIYGNRADELKEAGEFYSFNQFDTYNSGVKSYAIGGLVDAYDADGKPISRYVPDFYDGILDTEQGEINAQQYAILEGILAGLSKKSTEIKVSHGIDTTTSDKPRNVEFVLIPGGQSEMDMLNDAAKSEFDRSPVRVTVPSFKILKSEVTLDQYKTYLAATGDPQHTKLPDYEENRKGPNFPVVGLTYEEEEDFCEYYLGSLPTTAQIGYASKGPSHTDVFGTPVYWAATDNNGFTSTAEVCGTNDKRANGYGVCDLTGNVWETTHDQFDPSNPWIDSSQPYKALGGSWDDRAWINQSFYRSLGVADRYTNVGFRCTWPQDSK